MGVITVGLLGSTGSIGTQAMEVVAASPDRFRIVALAAQRSVGLLADQANRVRPEVVAIGDPDLAPQLAARVPKGTEVLAGPEGLATAAEVADVAVNGVVGFAGLPVTLAALAAGKRLGTGQQGIAHRRGPGRAGGRAGPPVPSSCRSTPSTARSTSACRQRLRDGPTASGRPDTAAVARLLVTASGGPFRGRTRSQLEAVRVDDALAHPTWQMGPKITVDSSTLMNKGLEVIEAHELFGIPYDRIEVVVHPQSVVHSMVELVDGATIAQLSMPDMRLPDRLRHGLARAPRRGLRRNGLVGADVADVRAARTVRSSRASTSPTVPVARAEPPRRGSTRRTRSRWRRSSTGGSGGWGSRRSWPTRSTRGSTSRWTRWTQCSRRTGGPGCTPGRQSNGTRWRREDDGHPRRGPGGRGSAPRVPGGRGSAAPVRRRAAARPGAGTRVRLGGRACRSPGRPAVGRRDRRGRGRVRRPRARRCPRVHRGDPASSSCSTSSGTSPRPSGAT